MRRFDLVCFDVDGTLVVHEGDKTVWQVLNAAFLGDDRVNEERYRRYRAGEITYPDWVALDIGDWVRAGATSAGIAGRIREGLRLVAGAREALAALKEEGCRLAVISGTLDVCLDTLFPDHPFDEVFTNKIRFDEAGLIRGWEATPFDMEGKALALREIARREGLPLARCAFVGDHLNDLEAAREAGFSIAFNPKAAEFEAVCDAVVRSDDLRDLLPLLLSHADGEDHAGAGWTHPAGRPAEPSP